MTPIVVVHISDGEQIAEAFLGQLTVELAYGRIEKRGDQRIHTFEGEDERRSRLQKRKDLVVQTLAVLGGYTQRATYDVMHSDDHWLSHGSLVL